MTKTKEYGIVIGVLCVFAAAVVFAEDITLPENKKSDTAQKIECKSKAPAVNRKVFTGDAVTTSTLTQVQLFKLNILHCSCSGSCGFAFSSSPYVTLTLTCGSTYWTLRVRKNTV